MNRLRMGQAVRLLAHGPLALLLVGGGGPLSQSLMAQELLALENISKERISVEREIDGVVALVGAAAMARNSAGDAAARPVASSLSSSELGAGLTRFGLKVEAAPLEAADPLVEAEPGNGASTRRHSGTLLPWVDVLRWGSPRSLDLSTEEEHLNRYSPLTIFDEAFRRDLTASMAPPYAREVPLPLFYVPPPRQTELSRKLWRFAKAKLFREVRSRVRSQWKEQYRSHPSMLFQDYEERLAAINSIGKDSNDANWADDDYTTTEVRQDVFRRNHRDGEADIPLFSWGPLTLTDSGSMTFDLGAAASANSATSGLEVGGVEVGKEKRQPLLATKDYRIDTSFKFNVDPLAPFAHGDVLSIVKRYGVTVEVDLLSDVLAREMLSAQIEFEADMEGDYAVFVAFVIKSR